MRLFLIAFTLSALSTAAFAQGQSGEARGQSGEARGSSWQASSSSRFELSPAQAYLMQRARAESEHRTSLLRYYDSVGFNYGAPEINGGVFFNAQPPLRFRRVFWTPPALVPYRYGL